MGLIKRVPKVGQQIITPSTANQTITKGEHDGSGYVKGDANLIPANIKKGLSIYGVQGSVNVLGAGDFYVYKYPYAYSVWQTKYTKIMGCRVQVGGTYRVRFSIWASLENTCRGKIYVNGIPRGIERSVYDRTTVYNTEDITVNDGDIVEIWAMQDKNTEYNSSVQSLELGITTLGFTDN